jgi:hypothetical protein
MAVDILPVDIYRFNPQVLRWSGTGAAPLLDNLSKRCEPQDLRPAEPYPQRMACIRSISSTKKL